MVQEVEQLKQEQQNTMTNILQELKTAMDSAEKLQGNINLPKDT